MSTAEQLSTADHWIVALAEQSCRVTAAQENVNRAIRVLESERLTEVAMRTTATRALQDPS